MERLAELSFLGDAVVAWMKFSTDANEHSAIVPLLPSAPLAHTKQALTLANGAAYGGRIFVVVVALLLLCFQSQPTHTNRAQVARQPGVCAASKSAVQGNLKRPERRAKIRGPRRCNSLLDGTRTRSTAST